MGSCFLKKMHFLYIGKQKNFSGQFGDILFSDFFQNLFGLGNKVSKGAILDGWLFFEKDAFFYILESKKFFRDILVTFYLATFFKICLGY